MPPLSSRRGFVESKCKVFITTDFNVQLVKNTCELIVFMYKIYVKK